MLKRFVMILMVLGLIVASTSLVAAVEINSITGTWANPSPVSGITINNTNLSLVTARWGDPVSGSGQSGYNFAPATTPFSPSLGLPGFVLGEFTHLNFPITGTTLSSIDLLFSVGITGASPLTLSSPFHFTHNETPNSYPAGDPRNNDIVGVTPALNQQFSIGSDTYFFHLMGFSQDAGLSFMTEFSTVEGQQNIASLYGEITRVPVSTPEPLTLVLLGLGIVGVAGLRRKK